MPEDRSNKISCGNHHNPIEVTIEILSGKWKALILWNLNKHEVIRFNQFKRLMPDITQKMLTQQLRNLSKYHLIDKTVYPQTPPMVEYYLTDMGKKIIPILAQMEEWGEEFIDFYEDEL
ncbi:MAG: helix-turn-helix transcriptional regulator [Firmicutes bacterium]|jgi:DNA-binding HxlR family transcriptional regulator|nr:helix-turn-helix transcriptional regulator [Bacillota bacterium]